jgi:shikimate kinase
MSSNIVLIGMPGSGKSTVGVILSKLTSHGFIDTDLLIQAQQGRTLQEIVDKDGYLVLRGIEEQLLLGLECRDQVIATGGSAVYSKAAMEHLRSNGIAVFLRVDIQTLKSRVHDYATRGLAKLPEQSVDDLFAERSALYRRYADITVDCAGLTHEEVCARVMKELGREGERGAGSE